MGSCLHNKYSEGQPGQRYYGGNQFIDKVELLAQKRALELYNLNPEEWGVNVQAYSGSPANFAVYTALVEPHGRIMGLDLPDGGHLTHGFYAPKTKVSATSVFFESLPYKVNPATGLIDYDELEKSAGLFKPRMIIAGISCYSRNLDYKRFREIADRNGSWLMADMAHVAGLVAAGLVPSPFEHCDIVTSTVHKTLRGPRAGIIFFRRNNKGLDVESKINLAVFPGLQGGPHNHAIAGIATAMKQASTPEFKQYQQQVVANAKAVASGLINLGYNIITGGTDCHIVPGDQSALNPSGVRFGTPALTTRGMDTENMVTVVRLIHSALQLGAEIQTASGPKLVDFKKAVYSASWSARVDSLKQEVEQFSCQFMLPGQPVL